MQVSATDPLRRVSWQMQLPILKRGRWKCWSWSSKLESGVGEEVEESGNEYGMKTNRKHSKSNQMSELNRGWGVRMGCLNFMGQRDRCSGY